MKQRPPTGEEGSDPLGSIFLRFLKFGGLAWGGPAAQISMIERECVEEERWVEPGIFRRTLAVYQVLPGPEAHELCVYFGRLRGGRRGGLLAGLGFMLPGFLLMLAFSVLYVEAGLDERFAELFYGLQAAVGALVAMAVVRLSRKFIDDLPLALLAAASFALTLLVSAGFLLILGGAGLAYFLWRGAGLSTSFGALAPSPFVLAAGAGALVSLPLTGELLLEGLKAGLVTFGGAYTVIPFLQERAVDAQGWITQQQFVDGIALAGVLPAPAVIFSTFVGYLAGGTLGALAITFGIFLPAFLFPLFFHRTLVRIERSPRAHDVLLGVAAGVIGLIAAVTVTILETAIVDLPSALIALGAFALLLRFGGKLTVLWVVLGAGLLGAALQLTVL